MYAQAFCGSPSHAPEGLFDWIAFDVLRGPDSKPFTGPLTHPTPEKAIKAYEWVAGSTFKYTLEVGGVILATVDGDGDDATLASVCLAFPPNDAELFDVDKKLGNALVYGCICVDVWMYAVSVDIGIRSLSVYFSLGRVFVLMNIIHTSIYIYDTY